MSFFQLSTGQSAQSTGEFDSGGGDFDPIPKDTNVLAAPEEAKIAEYEGNQYINIKWRVAAPEMYKNRLLFQKVQVWHEEADKRDKAIQMLAAIDANCGGKLAKSGQEPTDLSLQKSLVGKPMVLKLGVWKIDDKSGNWIMAVSPAKKAGKETPPEAEKLELPKVTMPNVSTGGGVDMGDDIPF